MVGVRSATGDPHGLVHLALEHESGVASVASMCGTCPIQPSLTGAELYGPTGSLSVDCQGVGASAFVTLAEEFVTAARSGEHPLDVRRGLHLQEVLEVAGTALADG